MRAWMTIIKLDNELKYYPEIDYYNQFVGQTGYVTARWNRGIWLRVCDCNGNIKHDAWYEGELRPATKEEIKRAELAFATNYI